jgi:hypothetical protein
MAVPPIYITWDQSGITTIRYALRQLETGRAQQALRRALNHTGNKTLTGVRRSLQRHANIPAAILAEKNGYLYARRASDGNLQFKITGSGKPIRIRHFSPKQLSRGYSFKIWGERKQFKSAFTIKKGAKWGTGTLKEGGNFYVRAGKARFPLHAMFGATVSKDMIKTHTVSIFHATVNKELPQRVLHEIRWITNGTLS